MTDQDHLDRINALTRNARQTWFALLAAMVFVGITLMGVEHIDFYGVDRATALPLVNVEVPTRLFFIAAPILIAAIYGYFHLYLIRLWDALGAAPAGIHGIRLGDAISPWLLSDAALHLRAWKRNDYSTANRALEGGSMALNLSLAWLFGLFILGWLWWLSLPARTFWMSSIATTSFFVSLLAAIASLETVFKRLLNIDQSVSIRSFKGRMDYPLLSIILAAMLAVNWFLTEGPADYLAPLDLSGENIVERPAGWLSYRDAKAEFRADWCRREFIVDKDCKDLGDREQAFADEFARRRNAALADMRRPDWSLRTSDPTHMDFRNPVLTNAFLAGANLRRAQMQGVDLWQAQMEGANLIRVQMQEATLVFAQMQGANLREAQMQGATLNFAQINGANFRRAHMQEAVLFRAQMQRASFREAQMEGASFHNAQMEGADFFYSVMEGADLRGAQMQGAILNGAQMQGAVFDFSELTGSPEAVNSLAHTGLSRSTNNGGLLRFVDLTEAAFNAQTDFRNAFLDGSVKMTAAFRTQMGSPCQWVDRVIEDDAAFYGRWRWWVEARPNADFSESWQIVGPEEWRDVTPIPPDDPDCAWKTDPMPGAPSD